MENTNHPIFFNHYRQIFMRDHDGRIFYFSKYSENAREANECVKTYNLYIDFYNYMYRLLSGSDIKEYFDLEI